MPDLNGLWSLAPWVLLAHALANNLFWMVSIHVGTWVFVLLGVASLIEGGALGIGQVGSTLVAACSVLAATAVLSYLGVLAQQHRARINRWAYGLGPAPQFILFLKWVARSRYLLIAVAFVLGVANVGKAAAFTPLLALFFGIVMAVLIGQIPDGFGIRAHVLIRSQGLRASRQLRLVNTVLGFAVVALSWGSMTRVELVRLDSNLQLAVLCCFAGIFCWVYRFVYGNAYLQTGDAIVRRAIESARITVTESAWGLGGIGLAMLPAWLEWPWTASFPFVAAVTLGVAFFREHRKAKDLV